MCLGRVLVLVVPVAVVEALAVVAVVEALAVAALAVAAVLEAVVHIFSSLPLIFAFSSYFISPLRSRLGRD